MISKQGNGCDGGKGIFKMFNNSYQMGIGQVEQKAAEESPKGPMLGPAPSPWPPAKGWFSRWQGNSGLALFQYSVIGKAILMHFIMTVRQDWGKHGMFQELGEDSAGSMHLT